MSQIVARPWAKWVGGKTKLLPHILPRLPEKIGMYYEPFVGGGAVFFALAAEKRFKRAMLGDSNEELIRTYGALKNHPDLVIKKLKKHLYAEEYYYRVRAQNPRTLETDELAARFIYLNRVCFNGLYRVNKKGVFNVPFGSYTNPTICDEENLWAVSESLDRAVFSLLDFEDTVGAAKQGDAVYCDPPYWPISDTANFTAYSAGGFGAAEQERLRDVAARLVGNGVHVLLSNSDTPFVRQLYKDFKIEEVQAPRRVNSKGGKRGNVGELLISGRSV